MSELNSLVTKIQTAGFSALTTFCTGDIREDLGSSVFNFTRSLTQGLGRRYWKSTVPETSKAANATVINEALDTLGKGLLIMGSLVMRSRRAEAFRQTESSGGGDD